MTLPQKARSNRPPEVYRRVFLSTIDPARLIAANINPTTLLATDYLNHFNEASMMLEMLPEIPDCITDLVQWRPLTYAEHFAESIKKHGGTHSFMVPTMFQMLVDAKMAFISSASSSSLRRASGSASS